MKKIFVTGTSGFIGFHLAEVLLQEGWTVYGFDGLTDYYDVNLKKRRTEILCQHPNFSFTQAMLEDSMAVQSAVESASPHIIVHLAAQAGVRYSIENPRAYLDSNIVGTFNVMEAARSVPVQHLLMFWCHPDALRRPGSQVEFYSEAKVNSPGRPGPCEKKLGPKLFFFPGRFTGVKTSPLNITCRP